MFQQGSEAYWRIIGVLQVVVSSYEAASSIIIEFDMDNSIFGLPREFVVASAGKQPVTTVDSMNYLTCPLKNKASNMTFCILVTDVVEGYSKLFSCWAFDLMLLKILTDTW